MSVCVSREEHSEGPGGGVGGAAEAKDCELNVM